MTSHIRLGDHAIKIGSGQTPLGGQTSYQSSGIPFIRSQNVLMGTFTCDGLAHISEAQDRQMSGSRVEKRDVLINITGASIGRVCVVPDDVCPANVNQHVCIIRCDSALSPEYLAAFLASPNFQEFIWQSQAGGTRQALRKEMVEGFQIPWLPVRDQNSLVSQLKSQLAAVEQARQAAKAQVDDANRLIPAILESAFSEITEANFVKLGDIANIQLGKMLSPKSKTGEQSFTYLRNTNVQWGRFDLRDLAFMDFSDRERMKFELQAGDLIVCEGGEPGRCAVWNAERADCYYQKALHRVRPHKVMADSEFLSYWIRHQAYAGSFEDQNAKTTIAHLPLVRLEQLPIPNVPIQRQLRIAESLKSRLATVDEILHEAQAQLEQIRQLPSRLLAQVFAQS